jgi:hypothetical protein
LSTKQQTHTEDFDKSSCEPLVILEKLQLKFFSFLEQGCHYIKRSKSLQLRWICISKISWVFLKMRLTRGESFTIPQKNKPDRKRKKKKKAWLLRSRVRQGVRATELERRSSLPRSGELVSCPAQPNRLMAVFFSSDRDSAPFREWRASA